MRHTLLVQALSEQFPRSDWIVCQAAIAHYNLRNFDEAEDLFQDLLERDPHRIEVHAPISWQRASTRYF